MARKQRFSDQLRRAVKHSDKTCYRIAKVTGIDQGNLSRFMNHDGGLSLESIDRLCDCLRLRLVGEVEPTQEKGR
jgi:hypothetical protein